MNVLVCPGVHSPEFTEEFVVGLGKGLHPFLIFPGETLPVYSPQHVLEFLESEASISVPIICIGFSAGVVGAIGAARRWQTQGGTIRAFIAIDGWGVPLFGTFPIHRLSHDYFTHWSSALLGRGADSFYADPSVHHLDLWRSPQTVTGRWFSFTRHSTGYSLPRHTTAATFLTDLINRYKNAL